MRRISNQNHKYRGTVGPDKCGDRTRCVRLLGGPLYFAHVRFFYSNAVRWDHRTELEQTLPHVAKEQDLERDVQHLGVSSPKTWSPKTVHFRVVVRPNRDSSEARLSPESNALQTNGKQLNKPRRVWDYVVSFVTSFPLLIRQGWEPCSRGHGPVTPPVGGDQEGQQQLLQLTGRSIAADTLTPTGLFIAAHYPVVK